MLSISESSCLNENRPKRSRSMPTCSARLPKTGTRKIELDASETAVLDIGGVYRGRDAVKRFWREWLAAWETMRFEYELVDAGDRVVQLFDMQMRGRSTHIEIPFGDIAWVYTYRDGRVIHQKLYMSHSEALEAVGLSEQGPGSTNSPGRTENRMRSSRPASPAR